MATTVSLEGLIRFDAQAKADLDAVGPLEYYMNEQAQGRAALYAVFNGSKRCGSVLVRHEIEASTGRKICVIVAGKTHSEKSVLNPGIDILERMAVAGGCAGIRLHTDRIGLIKNLLKRNSDAETVVEWNL